MSTAFITILLSDSYLPGVLVLSKQLIKFHPEIPRCILISSHLKTETKKLVSGFFDEVITIEKLLESANLDNLKLFDRLDLVFTISKVYVFKLTQFDKLIYIDADVLPLKPLDDKLLQLQIDENTVAASPDASWPDIFNSGFVVLKPSEETFQKLSTNLDKSFDGADQGLLNEHFTEWTRLPFLYNVTVNYLANAYEYLPLLNHFKSGIFNVHFIGAHKPWLDRDTSLDTTGFYSKWWDVFNSNFTDASAEIFEASGTASVPVLVQQIPSLLSRGPEAENFKEIKFTNKWDQDEEEQEQSAAVETVDSPYPPPIFPWEKNRVKPTRKFGPDSEYLEPVVLDKLSELDIEGEQKK